MTKVRGSFTQYVPVKLINFSPGSQSLLFNIQGGTILGDLPPYEAFSLGGSSGVRGYEEGDVGSGRSYVQATAEYRFPIVSFLGLGIFADYGTDLGTGSSVPGNPAGVRSKPGSGFGYGAGVRFQSPFGPLRLDYGLNDRQETRIQFGLGERF
jgi:outer membrane protein insertion porin family